MLMDQVEVGPFQCNCRIIVCPDTAFAALIDPGDEAPKILKLFERVSKKLAKPITISSIFHTHGHLDHIAATKELSVHFAKTQSKAPDIWIHKEDEPLYLNLKTQSQMFGLNYEDPTPATHYFEDDQILNVGKLKFEIRHTPGHSPGSVCLAQNDHVFTGDTLFQNSIGRTDLWGGDYDVMMKSIRSRILTYDDDLRVCPGHGPDSKIGIEKRSNPFLS